MPQLGVFSKDDLPRDLAIQIASYVRVQWPFLLGTKTPLWESAPYPADGKHFILFDGDVLISHVLVLRKQLSHIGQEWNVGGLASVFTYPTHRGAGHGEKVVAAASDYLRNNGETDFALLFCGERVSSLYLRTGWEFWKQPPILFGDKASPQVFDAYLTMGMMVSQRARDARAAMEGQPLYVGQNTW
jgi:aminoglycoside 2'-N-acetyltransferase I